MWTIVRRCSARVKSFRSSETVVDFVCRSKDSGWCACPWEEKREMPPCSSRQLARIPRTRWRPRRTTSEPDLEVVTQILLLFFVYTSCPVDHFKSFLSRQSRSTFPCTEQNAVLIWGLFFYRTIHFETHGESLGGRTYTCQPMVFRTFSEPFRLSLTMYVLYIALCELSWRAGRT